MKKLIIILLVIVPGFLYGQQFPFLEGYNSNPFSMSPAYAGLHNPGTVFIDYRSDWTGLEGGPVTYQLSYNDRFKEKVGLGARLIYDKTDIFKQTLFLATYSYEVEVSSGHLLNFALSAGVFRNSIDLTKYYNDPEYVQDLVLMYGQQNSKLKFATDMSALYRYNGFDAGLLFSNIMFGTAKYRNSDMTYKPLKNYQLHASYNIKAADRLEIKPVMIFRGGEKMPSQFEVAPTVTWNKRIWATAVFRTGGVFGAGFGGEVVDGLILNYSYNMSSNVALNTFSSHQLTMGFNLRKMMKRPENMK
jgi:type IX secretion system PorP/SprF family membrane protein